MGLLVNIKTGSGFSFLIIYIFSSHHLVISIFSSLFPLILIKLAFSLSISPNIKPNVDNFGDDKHRLDNNLSKKQKFDGIAHGHNLILGPNNIIPGGIILIKFLTMPIEDKITKNHTYDTYQAGP